MIVESLDIKRGGLLHNELLERLELGTRIEGQDGTFWLWSGAIRAGRRRETIEQRAKPADQRNTLTVAKRVGHDALYVAVQAQVSEDDEGNGIVVLDARADFAYDPNDAEEQEALAELVGATHYDAGLTREYAARLNDWIMTHKAQPTPSNPEDAFVDYWAQGF